MAAKQQFIAEHYPDGRLSTCHHKRTLSSLHTLAYAILLCGVINISLHVYQWTPAQIFDTIVKWSEERTPDVDRWSWSSVTPTSDLVWHPCHEEYDCARLDVPLDWLDPSDNLRAAIAIIRYNATDRVNYKGPVFINPGGPGGSGIWFVKHLAPYYQTVVGKNHDIISFDPRGIGASTPRIRCWDSEQNAQIWGLQANEVLDANSGALYNAYARFSAHSAQCASMVGPGSTSAYAADRNAAEAGIGRFVSTPSVARDMLEIMERVGEKKLKYWGFSYGTFLGTTFASMFPDKIDRMVNDGNVDAVEFSNGNGTHFIHDSEKVMASFYYFCHLAGPVDCRFYSNTTEEIEARLDKLLASLKKNPVVVTSTISYGNRPEIVSYSNVKRMIASSLYRPLIMFPALAAALAELEYGNGSAFVELSGQGSGDPFLCENDPGPTPELPEVEGNADATHAILCSDGGLMTDTVDEYHEYVNKLIGKAKSAGVTMAEMRMACVGWSVEAKWRFTGPFSGNTSFPILWIANIADNVTPHRSAIQNARGFPGSVILVSETYGHTSLAAPSKCTSKAIQAYFQTGALPVPGTVCSSDIIPFQKYNVSSLQESAADRELKVAMQELMYAPVIFG